MQRRTCVAGMAPWLVLCALSVPAAIAQLPAPERIAPLDAVERFFVPPIDLQAVTQEDFKREDEGLPPRFAIPNPVDITPAQAGLWEQLPNGRMLWRFRITSPGAYSLNLGFGRYVMPDGGTLRIVAADGSSQIGPFTAADNESHGELWTPIIRTDDIVIEVEVPDYTINLLELHLTSINHGYRGFGAPPPWVTRSGSCNVDVVCPEGDPWRAEIPAVAVISTGGSTFCSGFLVNNTAGDRTPFFMTANHCGIDSSNAASLVCYWNYQNSTCRPPGSSQSGGPGDGTLSQFNTGATFLASYTPSDFTLVQLDDPLNPAYQLSLAGWDATGADATSAVGIHHPNTDEKRISFENDPTTTTSYLDNAVPGDGTHVRITNWDLGTTEPGSSGSPLFNQDHRIIGQLHGGFASCTSATSDWYGKFAVSWNGGGTPSTRLSNWLDPLGTGALVIDTLSGAGLSVSPSGTVQHLGPVGGPFTNPSTLYTINNSTGADADYRVSIAPGGTAPILIDGGTADINGTILAGGADVIVDVTLDASVNSLPAGTYTSDVVFDDLTNGQSYTRTHVVEVGTTGFTVTPTSDTTGSGPVGGPFMGATTYTITSTRPTPVDVQIAASDTWISLDGAAGPITRTLTGTGDSTTVTVGFSAAADNLAAGQYTGSVSFTNASGGSGDTSRVVTLDVGRSVYPSTDTPITINDNSQITSTITVPDSFCIADVDVDVDITHTYIGDLIVTLTSPAGTTVTLHNRSGGSADNIVLTYDDATQPPDGPGLLSDYNFEDSAGTWTLTVSDNATADTGTLNSWSLRLATGCGNPPTVIYDFPLDSDPGWTTEGQWAFGVPTGAGSGSGDPTSGNTGTNVYGYNLSGDYTNNMPRYALTAGPFDLTGVTDTKLSFYRWLGVESATFDHASVEASNDGVNWTVLWDHTGGTITEASWSKMTLSLAAVADNQPTVYVRWIMGTTDSSVTYPGWNIDDVQILGVTSTACLGDADGDGDVDIADLGLVLANFGSTVPPGSLGDVDGSGVVDIADLGLVLANFGVPCP